MMGGIQKMFQLIEKVKKETPQERRSEIPLRSIPTKSGGSLAER
jgi:hypothetical protein